MRNRLGLAAAAAAASLLLTGCGEIPPGDAAVVDGAPISRHLVTDLADAQCYGVSAAAKKGQTQAVSRTQLTQRALGLLIDIKLNLAYGASLGLRPRTAQVAHDFAQVKPLIQSLPAKYQVELTDIFQHWAAGRDLVAQVGEQASGQTLTDANSQQVLNAGYAKREPWIKTIKIHTDARYSPGKVGWPGEGDSSVSTPVSSSAKAATSATPSAAFVAGLPANQRCG